MLENMRCIAGSMRFENGKIHDVLFLGMPKLERNTALTRSSASLGTKETFFYLSLILNLGDKIDALNQSVAAFAGAKLFQALADSGITADDWKAAFGLEAGIGSRLAFERALAVCASDTAGDRTGQSRQDYGSFDKRR